MLRIYRSNPPHILQPQPVELREDLTYEEGPVRIMDREVRQLRSKAIPMVKVLWSNHSDREATWELETDMRAKYPFLFPPGMILILNCEDAISLRGEEL